MNSAKKRILFWAVGLLVAFSLLWLFILPHQQGELDEMETVLSNRSERLFSSVKVTNDLGDFSVTMQGGNYRCAELGSLDASTSTMEKMAKACCVLTAYGTVKDWAPSDTEYGFDTPYATASIAYTDGTALSFSLGDQTPDGRGHYLRIEGERSVYAVESGALTYFLGNAGMFADLSLAPPVEIRKGADPSAILANTLPSSVSFTNKNGSFSVAALNAAFIDGFGNTYLYVLQGDTERYVDQTSFISLFGRALEMKAELLFLADPSEQELEMYGLGSLSHTNISISYNGLQTTIQIGNKGGEYYYVQKIGTAAIFLMPSKYFTFEEANAYSLTSRYFAAPARAKVQSITASFSSGENYIVRSSASGGSVNGSSLGENTFIGLYRLLCSLRAEYELTETATYSTPELTLTFRLKDGTKTKIELVAYGESRYAVFENGSATCLVRSAFYEKLLSVFLQLKDGQTIDVAW